MAVWNSDPDKHRVPLRVLEAFGLNGTVSPIGGGQGTSVIVGDVVLKPGSDEEAAHWLTAVVSRVVQRGFRLSEPVLTVDGRAVVDGWTASRWLAGSAIGDNDRDPAAWLPVLKAGRAFTDALRGEPPPAFLASRSDRWAQADRAAWRTVDARLVAGPGSLVHRMSSLVVTNVFPDQLVHADLSGNVLVEPGLDPAIIDISPYWRPAPFADAVVVVDALLWWHTDFSLVDVARPRNLDEATWISLLARAAMFRLFAIDESRRAPEELAEEKLWFGDVVGELEERVASP